MKTNQRFVDELNKQLETAIKAREDIDGYIQSLQTVKAHTLSMNPALAEGQSKTFPRFPRGGRGYPKLYSAIASVLKNGPLQPIEITNALEMQGQHKQISMALYNYTKTGYLKRTAEGYTLTSVVPPEPGISEVKGWAAALADILRKEPNLARAALVERLKAAGCKNLNAADAALYREVKLGRIKRNAKREYSVAEDAAPAPERRYGPKPTIAWREILPGVLNGKPLTSSTILEKLVANGTLENTPKNRQKTYASLSLMKSRGFLKQNAKGEYRIAG